MVGLASPVAKVRISRLAVSQRPFSMATLCEIHKGGEQAVLPEPCAARFDNKVAR